MFQGDFVKMPADRSWVINVTDGVFRAVVVSGPVEYRHAAPEQLSPGSYFGSDGKATHSLSSLGDGVVLYVRSSSPWQVCSAD